MFLVVKFCYFYLYITLRSAVLNSVSCFIKKGKRKFIRINCTFLCESVCIITKLSYDGCKRLAPCNPFWKICLKKTHNTLLNKNLKIKNN